MAEGFRRREYFQPDGINTGGAEVYGSLADRLRNFSGRALEGVAQIRTAEGAAAGEQAGLAGAFQRQNNSTVYGRAYNSAAEHAYLASQSIDIESSYARLEHESKGDPEKFKQLSEGYQSGLLGNAPPELRGELTILSRARAAEGDTRVQGSFWMAERDTQRTSIRDGLEVMVDQARRMVVRDDPQSQAALGILQNRIVGSLEAAVGEKLFSSSEAFALREQYLTKLASDVSEGMVENEVSGIMSAYETDVLAGDHALGKVDGLTYDDATKAKIRSTVRERINLMQDERKRQFIGPLTALHKDIADGVPSANAEGEAFQLYRRGALETGQYTSLISSIERARVVGAKKEAEGISAQFAFENSVPFDPKDAEARKGMDTLFRSMTAGVERGSPEYQNLAVEMARRTNIIPSDAFAWSRTVIAAGDPEESILASNFLRRVEDTNPVSFDYIEDAKLKSFVGQVSDAINAGAPPDQAVAVAHRQAYELTPAEQDAYRRDYQGKAAVKQNDTELQSRLNSDDRYDRRVFGGAPNASLKMRGEFAAAVERYHTFTGGDLDKARDLAWRDVKRTWAYSEVNGKPELMKWAPEAMYPGLTVEVVRKDLEAVAAKTGGGTLRLVETGATARTHGQEWNLGRVDQYGAKELLRDEHNRPLRYQLPVSEKDFKAQRDAIAAEKVEAARAYSKKQRQLIEVYEDMATSGDEDAERLLEHLRTAP